MGVGAGLYVYDVVVKKFTFAISSPDEFLLYNETLQPTSRPLLSKLGTGMKDDKFRYLIPILRKLEAAYRTSVDGSLESPYTTSYLP